jgi:hypothetical protein
MFKFVAKVVTFRARPFASKPEKMRIVSRGFAFVAHGYSRDSVIHKRPAPSNAMFIGLRSSGSAATSCTVKPGGSWKVFCCSSGVSGSVGRTPSANGSGAATSGVSETVQTTETSKWRIKFMAV